MGLHIFEGESAPKSFIRYAESFQKVPEDKIKYWFDWFVDNVVQAGTPSVPNINEIIKTLKLDRQEVFESIAFIQFLISNLRYSDDELASDLNALDLGETRTKILIDLLRASRTQLKDYLISTRDEAIPTLTEVNWRVDVRSASSDYLLEPGVVVLMRLLCNDGDTDTYIYLEMDKSRFSILEKAILNIKSKVIEAEELLNKMQHQ
jgi:hypothetical protein